MEIHLKCHHSSDDDEIENDDRMQTECAAMRRITATLDYYNSLMMNGNDHHLPFPRNQFIEFIDEHYGERMLLEDYLHCIRDHRDPESTTKMTANLKFKCFDDFKKCTVTPRHYRDRSQDEKDPVHFYVDIMDSLHFNLLHLEDVGLRVNIPLELLIYKNDSNSVDDALSMMAKSVQQKRRQFPFSRLNSGVKSAKFSLTPAVKTNSATPNRSLSLNRVTDAIWTRTKNRDILSTFHQFTISQDFDTDALKEDCAIFKQYGISHLYQILQGNREAFSAVQWCLRYHRVSGSSFSTGKWFAYWPWYESQTVESLMIGQTTNWWRYIDFGGHSMKSLCVKPHFANLKEEVVFSVILSRFQFATTIVQKARQYLQTAYCKQLERLRIYGCKNQSCKRRVQKL